MGQEAYDKLWKLIGLRYKSHPWHGIEIGKECLHLLECLELRHIQKLNFWKYGRSW